MQTRNTKIAYLFFKFVKNFIYEWKNNNNKKKNYYLTGEYLISERILNNVSILSSLFLNNIGFFAHWKTQSATAEIIIT